METNFTEEERYYQARKKVEEIKKFYQHLTIYLLSSPITIVVNIMTSPEYLWCIWSVLGWGVAIVLHAMKAFDYFPFFNKEWEDKKINELMVKDKKSKWE